MKKHSGQDQKTAARGQSRFKGIDREGLAPVPARFRMNLQTDAAEIVSNGGKKQVILKNGLRAP